MHPQSKIVTPSTMMELVEHIEGIYLKDDRDDSAVCEVLRKEFKEQLEKNDEFMANMYKHIRPNCLRYHCDQVYTLESLPTDQIHYMNISILFYATMSRFISIVKIERVNNFHLYAQYQLKKLQIEQDYGYVKERTLFHGTKSTNIDSICKNNFDWRLVGKTGFLGCKYGKGVAFSPKASYASDYPRRCKQSPRTMFVVKVRTYIYIYNCNGKL